MTVHYFTELGFFTAPEINALKDMLDGRSYMNFHVSSSNCAGNMTLIVSTDYDCTEEELKSFFTHCAFSTLYRLHDYWRLNNE